MERIGGTLVEQPLRLFNDAYDIGAALAGFQEVIDEGHQQQPQDLPLHQCYSPEIAALLSQVSGWSYSNISTFRNKLSCLTLRNQTLLAQAYYYEFNVRNEALLVHSTGQLIMTHDRTIAIVSFRGTELTNPLNWFTDAATKKLPFFENDIGNNCKVHLGFKRNMEAVWYGSEGIVRKLIENENSLVAIYLTGHSLGGAMAVLAGLALQQEQIVLWNKVRGIFTFGQPMVVDDWDRNVLEARIGMRLFRHIYFNDVIPHLPPLSVGGFDHVGYEYRFHPNHGWRLRTNSILNIGKKRATQIISVLFVIPALGYDLVWDNIQFVLPFTKSPWSLADHNPGCYMDNW
jgi:Lipase (class 3)